MIEQEERLAKFRREVLLPRLARMLPKRLFGGPVGNCYATSEALYHLLGGKKAGWKPMRMQVDGGNHWFIMHVPSGCIVDATAAQFGHQRVRLDYSTAVGCGWLTKKPSKRARRLMQRLVFSEEANA